ncbi:o-succinylbenzoate synthase [Halobacillus sp. Cin3]|uniref:o-succinylbenzoate synthase n=1 Tax=Halobacillus sp. Cin3 TaxID=2928441 RepID=UPI00248EC095|nr:o-succinylbenzoate synthase [Halobacillus sp. Cin3]
MNIEKVILRQIKMDLLHPFTTSVGTEYDKDVILVEVQSANGHSGWAESVSINEPIYNEETIDTNWPMLRKFLLPELLKAPIGHPREVSERFQSIRGQFNAKAAVEQAVWDLYAKEQGRPLAEVLGGTKSSIDVGVSIGITESEDALLEKIAGYVKEGYKRIKVKIKPGWDVELLGAVRRRFPDLEMMADANCAYTLDDIPRLKQLDDLNLMMIEQPLAHDDIIDHAELQKHLNTPICLDESLHSYDDVRKAIELGSCRIVNLKIGRVGGLQETLKIHKLCQDHHIPMWCGGMLETGIGRAHNIAVTALPQFLYPGDTAPSSHYWERDIIHPEVRMDRGEMKVPDQPGIGFEPDIDYIEQLTSHKETFTPKEMAVRQHD